MILKRLRLILMTGLLLMAASCTQQNIMFDEDYVGEDYSMPAENKKQAGETGDGTRTTADGSQAKKVAKGSKGFTYDENRIDDNWPVYKVATMEYYPPFIIRDELRIASGFDVELLTAIGRSEHFNLVFIPQTWKTALDNLDNGSRHITASGISMTEKLKEKYELSDPYYQVEFGAMVDVTDFPEMAKYKNLSELLDDRRIKFAVLEKTDAHERLKELLNGDASRIVVVETLFDEFKSVVQGTAGAAFNNVAVLNQYKRREFIDRQKEFKIHAGDGSKQSKQSMVFVLKKGNSNLARKINSGLQKIKANGEYDRLRKKWFAD